MNEWSSVQDIAIYTREDVGHFCKNSSRNELGLLNMKQHRSSLTKSASRDS